MYIFIYILICDLQISRQMIVKRLCFCPSPAVSTLPRSSPAALLKARDFWLLGRCAVHDSQLRNNASTRPFFYNELTSLLRHIFSSLLGSLQDPKYRAPHHSAWHCSRAWMNSLQTVAMLIQILHIFAFH